MCLSIGSKDPNVTLKEKKIGRNVRKCVEVKHNLMSEEFYVIAGKG